MSSESSTPRDAVNPSTVPWSGTGGSAADPSLAHSSAELQGQEDDEVTSVPGARILVIDNEIETADFLVTLMENAGYLVEVATDGASGLRLCNTFEPEVILLALRMPGMTGYEVTKALRHESSYAQRFRFTRIYYICDKQHMLQTRFDALPGTPMSDYIFKPIDVPELLIKVARAVGESRGDS